MNDLVKSEHKAEVNAGGALAALAPQNLDDAFRLAKALALSGDMVPKHFQGKPEATMAAIIRGMEIGLMPMQALSNIAVINGRASVWGDALPALMQRAGHSIDVDITGEGEKMVATATLIRGDTGKELVRTFSVDDAKKAGLWGKQGPWQQYPKRMLSNRARSLACRDGAADALMGLQVAEEMRDAPPIRDVTPTPTGGWITKAREARGEVLPADDAPEQEDANSDATDEAYDPETGEVESGMKREMDSVKSGATKMKQDAEYARSNLPDEVEDAELVNEFDEDAVDPMTDEYDEGFKASAAQLNESTCPHDVGTFEWNNWIGGYRFHAANAEKAEDGE